MSPMLLSDEPRAFAYGRSRWHWGLRIGFATGYTIGLIMGWWLT